MSDSRSRKRNNNRRGSTGKVLALLFVILISAAAVFFCMKYKDKLMPERETIEISKETDIVPETEPQTAQTEAAEQNEIETLPVVEKETEPEYKPEITLTFAGDVLFDPSYAIMASMLQRGGDISSSFDEELMKIMVDSDVFMLNNEFPYSDSGEPLPEKQFTFRAKPEYAAKLYDIGADIVGLANNHVNDYGTDAMLDTFDTLEAAGIPYVGAGRNLEEASAPYYMEAEGVKLAFVAATQIERLSNPDTVAATETTPGVFRCLNPDLFIESIKEAKQNADIVIAFVHWGTEGEDNIDWLQQEQAPMYAEAGADMIIGDHPHVLQKIEYIDGVPCIYSLGNYLFNSSTVDTGLVQATIDTESKELKSFRFIPAIQSGCKTKMPEASEKERVIRHMRELSPDVTIDDEGFVYSP